MRNSSPRQRSTAWDWLALLAGIPVLAGLCLLEDGGGNGGEGGGGSAGAPAPGPTPPAGSAELQAVIASFAAQNQAGAAALEKVIGDLRSENAGHRTKNNGLTEQWNRLAESVGLAKGAAVNEVVDAFAKMGGEVRAVKVEREIEKAAATHKADAELVAALIARDKVTDGVADDKLAETLDAKVKEYVAARPNLRLASVGRSGPDITPDNGGPVRKGLGGALDKMMGVGA